MNRVLWLIVLFGLTTSLYGEVGLRVGLSRFSESYRTGEWRQAGDIWLELSGVFDGEPEWRVCVGHYGGAAGLSLLFSGRPGEALAVIEAGMRESAGDVTPWLNWLRAVSLEVLGRLDAARQLYLEIAAGSDDPAVAMLSRLRAAVVGREEEGLKVIAGGEHGLPSLRHAAQFHLLLQLLEGGRFSEAAEWVMSDRPTDSVIARPGLWGLLLRNIVIGCREGGDYALASIVADRIQPPPLLLHHLQVRRRGLEEGQRGLDGTLRGNIRVEHMRRIWAGLGEDERVVEGWQADWFQFRLFMGEVYASAGRRAEAGVLFEAVFEASGGSGNLAERALLALLGLATEDGCGDEVGAALERYELGFPAGDLRGEAVAMHAWWNYRRGRDIEVRESINGYLTATPGAIARLPRLLLLSAHAALRLGDVGAAREDLGRASSSGDRRVIGRARLAEALCTALEGDVPGALVKVAELRRQGDISSALRADIYREELRLLQLAGLLAEALVLIADYRQTMDPDIPWPDLSLWEGDIHLRLGDRRAAELAYLQVPQSSEEFYPTAVVRRARLLRQSAAWQDLSLLLQGAFISGVFDESREAVEGLWLWLSAEAHRGDGRDSLSVYHQWVHLILALPADVDVLGLWRRVDEAGWIGGSLAARDGWYREQLERRQSAEGGDMRGGLARLAAAWVEHRMAAGRAEGAYELICEWAPRLDPQQMSADTLALIGRGLAEVDDPLAADLLGVIDDNFPGSRHLAVADVYFGSRALSDGDLVQARQRFRRAVARAVDPTIAYEAIEGLARVSHRDGDLSEALATLERTLADRRFRGRPHARALLLLGQLHFEDGDPGRGRGYYQRLVLLYGSHRDIVRQAEAELQCTDSIGGTVRNDVNKEAG